MGTKNITQHNTIINFKEKTFKVFNHAVRTKKRHREKQIEDRLEV